MSYQAWGSTLNVTSAPAASHGAVAGIGQDRFAIAWRDSEPTLGDASGTGIRMRIFDPFGVAIGPIVLVNTSVANNQSRPQVLGLASGEFVVVWEDNSLAGGDASGTSLKGQRFTANGDRLGVEFLVNTTTAGGQTGVTLAENGSGFVAAWVDAGGANIDIRAQRFDANGVKDGLEFVVGAATAGNQATVKATDTGSGFALSWTSDDNSDAVIDAIRVQAYTQAGATSGAEATILTEATRLTGLWDMARIDQTGSFVVGYSDLSMAQPEPAFKVKAFSTNGTSSTEDYVVGQSQSGYFVQGVSLAGWDTVTTEPGALSRGDNDGMLNTGGLFVAAVGTADLSERSTVRTTTSPNAPTVLDTAMLLDGRIVTVSQESNASISFTIADGRGASFGVAINEGPAVLVGADAGPDANNVLIGGIFADTLYGLGGNDHLYGQAGADILIGGLGSDVLIGEQGNDSMFGETGDDYLYGHQGNNVFVGGAGVDVLISQGTNDTLYGGDGGDYLYGYSTSATLAFGENGNDIFVMQSGPGAAYGGEGQDYFYMGAFADLMEGGAGVDVLQGGGGADTYDGGAGTDYLFLGNGADAVIFNRQSGVDVVNDFNVAQDVLRLQGGPFNSAAQVRAATTDYDSFSVITIDAVTAIWLIGVKPNQLTDANVLFA